ncbi:hypothetical protein D3C85_1089360 [compost metagenome]
MLCDLDVGLPQHGAAAGVDGGHAGFAVQHEDLAAVSHNRGHDLAGVAGTDADVALPRDRELRCGDDVFDRILGVAAGLGPGRGGLRTRQEEVTARQGGRGRQLLFELQDRDALALGRLGDVFLGLAQAERQNFLHRAARSDGQGEAAQQGDFQRTIHGWRPESVDYGRAAAGAASAAGAGAWAGAAAAGAAAGAGAAIGAGVAAAAFTMAARPAAVPESTA